MQFGSSLQAFASLSRAWGGAPQRQPATPRIGARGVGMGGGGAGKAHLGEAAHRGHDAGGLNAPLAGKFEESLADLRPRTQP